VTNPIYSIAKRAYRLMHRPMLVKRLNCQLILNPRNWIDNRILAGAPYEAEQLALARQEIAGGALDLVVDIGANFGLYTVSLGLLQQVTEVVAIEPVKVNFAQLLGNVYVNDLSDKVVAHNVALGLVEATAVMHVAPKSTGVSRLSLEGIQRKHSEFERSEQVQIRVFDSMRQDEGRRGFVKIDVEGHAGKVVQGMARFLAHNDLVLQVEIEDGVSDLLGAMGYRPFRSIGGDVFFKRG
jgi:FkbM family methyltransferase